MKIDIDDYIGAADDDVRYNRGSVSFSATVWAEISKELKALKAEETRLEDENHLLRGSDILLRERLLWLKDAIQGYVAAPDRDHLAILDAEIDKARVALEVKP